jgi:hypothetical protein
MKLACRSGPYCCWTCAHLSLQQQKQQGKQFAMTAFTVKLHSRVLHVGTTAENDSGSANQDENRRPENVMYFAGCP